MQKLVLNVLLLRKVDSYRPTEVVIEKVIRLPTREFDLLREHLLRERGYTAVKQYVPRLKDWNEILKARHGMEALPAVPHRRKEEYYRQAAALPSIRCPPEKLIERIRETHAQNQYTDLAAYAMNRPKMSRKMLLLKKMLLWTSLKPRKLMRMNPRMMISTRLKQRARNLI